ncbi:c-type cytochrome biogenesis protein CcmI, partial [Pantoea agglomerans]|uniref:c-type cytochrome biogenesis protein CcmI n=1 Tax=Enterobacter agglomerans TaxID=549 RepID=UPI003C7B5932
ELAQDEDQGVVAERPLLERELQQTLLADIPPAQTMKSPSSSRWILLPGLIVLIGVSLGTYQKTGGLAQLTGWKQVQQAY